MTEAISRKEACCFNDKVKQVPTQTQNDSSKKLLLAGLSIFAPGELKMIQAKNYYLPD